MKTAIIIPARMASKRFPNKPMAKINGIPMIERVWKQGKINYCEDVYVAVREMKYLIYYYCKRWKSNND